MRYVFVGCSSSDNIVEKRYFSLARDVGTLLGKMGYGLVFGAYNHGLMGEVYKTVRSYGGSIIGVAPKIYENDFKGLDCSYEFLTETIGQRAVVLIDKADILLFLPGGTGTLEELIVSIEMKRRGEIDKPIIICDINGFYESFIEQFRKMDEGGFSRDVRELFIYLPDFISLEKLLVEYSDFSDCVVD